MTYQPLQMGRIVAVTVAVVTAGLLVAQLWPARQAPNPPRLSFVGMERAGLFDDRGTELWLVSFNILNGNSVEEGVLFVRDSGRAIQAQHQNLWKEVRGTSVMLGPRPLLELWPGREAEAQLLAPTGADACRVWLRCAAGVKQHSFKGTLGKMVGQLPVGIRSRVGVKFWRWLGFPDDWVPSSWWHEIGLELPLPVVPGASLTAP